MEGLSFSACFGETIPWKNFFVWRYWKILCPSCGQEEILSWVCKVDLIIPTICFWQCVITHGRMACPALNICTNMFNITSLEYPNVSGLPAENSAFKKKMGKCYRSAFQSPSTHQGLFSRWPHVGHSPLPKTTGKALRSLTLDPSCTFILTRNKSPTGRQFTKAIWIEKRFVLFKNFFLQNWYADLINCLTQYCQGSWAKFSYNYIWPHFTWKYPLWLRVHSWCIYFNVLLTFCLLNKTCWTWSILHESLM